MPSLELGSRDSCHQGLFVRNLGAHRNAPSTTCIFMDAGNQSGLFHATPENALADFCSQDCLRSHQRPVVARIVGHYMQWISIAVCCSQQYARPLPLVRTLDVNSTLSIPIHPQFCPDFSGIFKTPTTTHSTSFS